MIEITGYKTGKKYYLDESRIDSMQPEFNKKRNAAFTRIFMDRHFNGAAKVYESSETPEEILSQIEMLEYIQ